VEENLKKEVNMAKNKKILTNNFGAPVADDQNTLTAGSPGPALMYSKAMTDTDREHLIGNIVSHLGGAQKRIQLRQTALFFKADSDYGTRVAKGLKLDVKEVGRLANMSHEERAKATGVEG
jgi:catalase